MSDPKKTDQGNITYEGLLEAYAKDCAPPDMAVFRSMEEANMFAAYVEAEEVES